MAPEAAHQGLYATAEPNAETTLYEGPLALLRGPERVEPETVFEGRGEVVLSWLPTPRIRFALEYERPPLDPDPEFIPHRLRIPGATEPAHCELFGISRYWNGSEMRREVVGRLSGPVLVGKDVPTPILEFHVSNFPDYTGSSIRAEEPRAVWAGRLTIDAPPWRVELDRVHHRADLVERLRSTGGYGITNVGWLTRLDGASFSREEGLQVLGALYYLLSLIASGWAGVSMYVGRADNGEVEWQCWQILRTTPSQQAWTWLPAIVTEGDKVQVPQFGRTFTKFLTLWGDDTWQQVLKRAIRWQVEAASAPVDTGLVLAQAGLELLSWARLVLTSAWTVKDFDKAPAHASIRALLELSQIPVAVPPRYYVLREGLDSGLDGPLVVTRGRNSIVHPHQDEAFVPASVREEACRLSLQYLELSLLHLLDFGGFYQDRSRWSARERVPWHPQDGTT